MLRRRFLKFLASASALITGGPASPGSEIARPVRVLSTSALSPRSAETGPTGFSLIELLTRKSVPLGKLRSYFFHVSLDDIADPRYLSHISRGVNALVVSAFEANGKWVPKDGALARAALLKLQVTSPNDYRNVSSQLAGKIELAEGSILPFELNHPTKSRQSFPIDHLIMAIFEEGSHAYPFDWVARVFEIAAKKNVSNLIVPCLGRNWQDRNSLEFRTFFQSFLERVPTTRRPAQVYFSLYAQWPSFELEEATESLNAAWRASSAARL